MADNNSFGSFFSNYSDDGQKKKRPDPGWAAYSWTPYQWAAYNQNIKMEPVFGVYGEKKFEAQRVNDYWDQLYESERPDRKPMTPFPQPVEAFVPEQQKRQLTAGEEAALRFGSTKIDPIANLFGIGPKSPRSEISPWFQDFTRAAFYGLPQTVASGIGSAIDLVRGETRRDQDYRFYGNRDQMYNAQDPSSLAYTGRMLGQFVPDIAMAYAGTGLAKMGMTSLMPAATRATAYAAARPLTMFGKVIGPTATTLERSAMTFGAMLPTLAQEFPETVAGRETPYEMLASTALAGLGGKLSAGVYLGGTRLSNTISDVGANLASNLMQSAAYTLPGGRQVTPEEVIAGQAYGAALGTMFGLIQKPTAALQRRVDPNAVPQMTTEVPPTSQASTTAEVPVTQAQGQQTPVSFAGSAIREAEMAVYGRSAIPEDASGAQASSLASFRPIEQVQSIKRTPEGTIDSINEFKVRNNSFPEGMSTAAAMQAAHLERRAYATALVKNTNPDALISLLELNRPAGSTPDVVAQAIIDEVLVQPGKGINEVEARLAQANLPSPLRAPEEPAPAIAGEPTAPVAAQPDRSSLFEVPSIPQTDTRYNILRPSQALGTERAAEILGQPRAELPADLTRRTQAPEQVAPAAVEPTPIATAQEAPLMEAPAVAEQLSTPEPTMVPEVTRVPDSSVTESGDIMEGARKIVAAASEDPVAKMPVRNTGKKLTAEYAQSARKVSEVVPKVIDQISAKYQEGSRQNIRTSELMKENLASFISGGEIDLGKPLTKGYRGGGRVSIGKEIVQEMTGLPINTVKRMVDEGVTFFAGDAIKVEKIGDNYIAKFMGKRDEVLPAFDMANIQNIPPKTKELLKKARTVDGTVSAAKQVRDDVQEMFSFADNLEGIVPSYASVAEALDDFTVGSEKVKVSDLTVDDSGLATNYTKWLRSTGRNMRQSADEIKAAMDKIDASPSADPSARLSVNQAGEPVTPQIIGRYLMAKYGPAGFRDLSSKWLDINTSQAMRDHLESPRFQAFESRDPRFVNGIQRMIDSYVTYSDDEMLSAFRKTVGAIEDAKVAAGFIARTIGIDDPEKIREVYKKTPDMSPDEQADILTRMQDAAVADEQLVDAIEKVSKDAQYQVGRDDWAAVDKTLYENSKRYNWSLRNVPINSIASSAAALYIMNEYIDKLEDDETYFGVPGKTIKRFLGSDNAGYVVAGVAGIPGMKGRHKSAAKVGTRFGSLLAALDSKRQSAIDVLRRIDQGGDAGRYSLAQRPPAEFRAAAEEIVFKNYSDAQGNKYVKGTPEFESKVQEVMLIHKDSETIGIKPLSFTKAEGATRNLAPRTYTLSKLQGLTLDFSQMIKRNQFFRDYIEGPRNEAELTARNIETKIVNGFNEPYADIRSNWLKYKDGAMVDAMVLNDFLQTDINLNRANITPEIELELRKQAANAVRDKHFLDANGNLDEAAYNTYNRLQETFNVVRPAHFGSLVARDEGVTWYDARSHAIKLNNDLSVIRATVGAIDSGLKVKEQQYKALRSEYNKAVKRDGREAAEALLPEYKQQSKSLKSEIQNDKLKLKSLASDMESIEKSVKKIEDIDAGAKNSMESGYILRHRDGNAAFVLRLEYDSVSGLVGERREFSNAREAAEAERLYARKAVEKRRKAEPGIIARKIDEYEQKIIDAQEAGEPVDPKIEEALSDAYEQRARLSDYKPLSEMTNLEIRQELESYGVSLSLYDNKPRKVRANKAAAKAVMAALMSANQLRGNIALARTAEGFLPSKNKIAKGNDALVNNQSGDVLMYTGDDAPSIEGLIDAMEGHVDGAIDRQQFRQILEENLTYRDITSTDKGKKLETIWIDMVGLRAIASRYLEPSNPNLARRNNVEGYYNPDGNWSAKQKWDWLSKSAEMMQTQIANNTQQVIMRPIIADAIATLRKAEVRNGLIEYLEDFAGNTDDLVDRTPTGLSKAADAITRFTAIGTLAASVGSYLTNRGYGIYNARTNFSDSVRIRYGLQRMQGDGTLGDITWYSNMAEADMEFLKKKENGEAGWTKVEGYKKRDASFNEVLWTMFGAHFPETTFKQLAKSSAYYRDIYRAVERANIKEGTVVGNIALGSKVPTGSNAEKAKLYTVKLSSAAERQNNYTTALLAAESARVRLGITDTDWAVLTQGGKNDVIERVIYSAKQRIEQDAQIGNKLLDEIDALEKRLEVETNPELQASIRRELLIKQDALKEQVVTPEQAGKLFGIDPDTGKQITGAKRQELLQNEIQAKAVTNIIMKNIVGDRRFDQGGWTKADMTRIERHIKQYPLNRPFMVFTAPVFRQAGTASGIFYSALRRNGTPLDKLKRFKRVIAGAGIMTVLYGVYAAPTMIMPWFALADIAYMVEFLADLFEDDDGDTLNKFNNRTFWEKAGGAIAERYGGDREAGEKFVRATYTEGLVRYTADVNTGGEAGIFAAGRMPFSGLMISSARNAQRVYTDYQKVETDWEKMYLITNLLPSSYKRIVQGTTQFALNQKLDRYGNPIMDPLATVPGKSKEFPIGEALRYVAFGKRWSDVRSSLAAYEGSTPVLTPEDKVAFASKFSSLPYIEFTGGGNEQATAANFERDAADLQRLTSAFYREKYRPMADSAKELFLAEVEKNVPFTLGDGTTMTPKEVLSMVGASGNKAEFEVRGSGEQKARNLAYGYAERYAYSMAALEATKTFYGDRVGVTKKDEDFATAPGPFEFMMTKFVKTARNSYRAGAQRRSGR